MKAIYQDNSIHNDHHKEVNITVNGLTNLSELISSLSNDESKPVEDVSAEECQEAQVETESPIQQYNLFNSKIFRKAEHYERLKNVISSFIQVGNHSSPEQSQIKPTSQSEWYYIEKAIWEANIVAVSATDTLFFNQMVAWFPDLFNYKQNEKQDEMIRRYMKSLSAERSKWKINEEVVQIKDMKAVLQTKKMSIKYSNRVSNVAVRLKDQLEQLRKEIN